MILFSRLLVNISGSSAR